MKNTLVMISLWLVSLLGFGQTNPENQPIASYYFAVKDALVKGDEKLAAEKAAAFVKGVEAFLPADPTSNNAKQINVLKEKLKADGIKIANAKSIATQREHFILFSENFFALSKLTKTFDSPLYQFFCPMKKAIWLSFDNGIANPYYGNQMLTCGSLQETIK